MKAVIASTFAALGVNSAKQSCFYTVLFFMLMTASAWACPTCKEAIASLEDPAVAKQLTLGWARSIYFLMATPYLVFGTLTFWIVRSAKQAKGQK